MIRNAISRRDVFDAGLAIGAAAGSAKLVWAQPMLPGGCACPRSWCHLAASLQASRNVRSSAGKVLFIQERLRRIYGSREANLRRFAAATDDMGAKR